MASRYRTYSGVNAGKHRDNTKASREKRKCDTKATRTKPIWKKADPIGQGYEANKYSERQHSNLCLAATPLWSSEGKGEKHAYKCVATYVALLTV